MKLSSYHICIEGTIGVGKTSLAKLIAEEMEAKTVFEKFEENPFLGNFYSNKERYAMQTQLFFKMLRLKFSIKKGILLAILMLKAHLRCMTLSL